jgi:hypothetical protein
MCKCDVCGTTKNLLRISLPEWAGYFLYRCVPCDTEIKNKIAKESLPKEQNIEK